MEYSLPPTKIDSQPSPARKAYHLAYFSLALGIFIAVLDATAVNLLLPSIAKTFNSSESTSILIVNAYQISILVMLLPLGATGERIGHGKVYQWGLVLFTMASLWACVVDSLQALIVARILQGIGAAGIMAVNAALLRLIFPGALLGRKLGAISMIAAIASVSGPLLASMVLSVGSWQWLFALKVPIGVIALLAGYHNFPKNKSDSAPCSASGFFLNTTTFCLIFMGLSQLTSSVDMPTLLTGSSMLGMGLLLACVYVRQQSLQAQPLLPLDLLRLRDFSLSMGASTSAYIALTMVHLGLPFMLLNTYRYTAFEASALLLAWPLAMVLFSPVAGRLIGRLSDGVISSAGMLLFAAGIFSLALLPKDPEEIAVFWRVFLCGAGFALFHVPNNHTMVTAPPMERSGAGSAMMSASRLMGQCLGASSIALLFVIWPGHSGTAETVGMFFAGGFAAAATLLAAMQSQRW